MWCYVHAYAMARAHHKKPHVKVLVSFTKKVITIVFDPLLLPRECKRYMVHHHKGGSCRYTSRVHPSLQ